MLGISMLMAAIWEKSCNSLLLIKIPYFNSWKIFHQKGFRVGVRVRYLPVRFRSECLAATSKWYFAHLEMLCLRQGHQRNFSEWFLWRCSRFCRNPDCRCSNIPSKSLRWCYWRKTKCIFRYVYFNKKKLVLSHDVWKIWKITLKSLIR